VPPDPHSGPKRQARADDDGARQLRERPPGPRRARRATADSAQAQGKTKSLKQRVCPRADTLAALVMRRATI